MSRGCDVGLSPSPFLSDVRVLLGISWTVPPSEHQFLERPKTFETRECGLSRSLNPNRAD